MPASRSPSAVLAVLAAEASSLAAPALAGGPAPMGNQFTYQGDLAFQGSPFDDVCDVSFSLFDVATGGLTLGHRREVTVTVVDGRFTAEVPGWDPALFDGTPRWLEVAVRCPAGAGPFTTLDPRHRLTASPYSLVASSVKGGPVETDTLSVGPGGVTCTDCIGPGNLGDEAVQLGNIDAGAVDATAIATGAVGTDEIADGTIASDDLGAGVVNSGHVDQSDGPYVNKSQVYERTDTVIAAAGLRGTATAACDDSNDLPLAGGCEVAESSNVTLWIATVQDWSSPTDPASQTCTYKNNTTNVDLDVSARIACMSVPGL